MTGHGATPYVLCLGDVGTGPNPVSREEPRGGVQAPAADGLSPLSNRTGFRRDSTPTATGLACDDQADLECALEERESFRLRVVGVDPAAVGQLAA